MTVVQFLSTAAFSVPTGGTAAHTDALLTFFGRASVRISTGAGAVLYIDPYAQGDYSEPADIILVTHGHGDHNRIELPKRNPGCAVIAPPGAVEERNAIHLAEYSATTIAGVGISAVPAYNANHPRGSCVGYVLEFGGIKLYHAADTSLIPEMAALRKQDIDYALLPCDGRYNMGPDEAARAAVELGARHVIPIHSSAEGYSGRNASLVRHPGVIVLEPGKTLRLKARANAPLKEAR
jgi:L-ascorbate metabolism protein UlaG (beta-lactamase superfamily)